MSKKKAPSPPAASATAAKTSVNPAKPGSPMDVGLLAQIMELMSANDVNTIDVRDGVQRVIVKRGPVVSGAPVVYSQAPAAAVQAPVTAPASTTSATVKAAAADDEAGLVKIKSPMVGTFYSAPSPDAKPFVQIGTAVNDESDVCVIEAMKVFNNIKAETHGTIAKVLVTNGQTVEFGQTLFLVKP